jgi:orotidine-5'-phosphate decarboxylase
MEVLQRLIRRARDKGLLTILDSKRNDIASTAAAYADAALNGIKIGNEMHPVWDADAMTVNPYLGQDAIEPFIASARRSSRGLFLLVRTSNPGARQFQNLETAGRPLFLHVAGAVRAWTRQNLGKNGFGDVGAVVGATHPDELGSIRTAIPEGYFLVPGLGAQGATAAETASAFRDDGLGAIINSSRAILFCFSVADNEWEEKIETATKKTIAELAQATPMGRLQLKD